MSAASASRTRFFLVSGYAGSVIRFRGHLIDALLAQGLEVHVAAAGFEEVPAIREQLLARGVVVHALPIERTGMNLLADLRSCLHFYRLFRQQRPHAVLAYMNKPVIYGLTAAWLARVPRRFALMTGLGFAFQDENFDRPVARLIRRLYQVALSVTARVFFQNPDDEAMLRELRLLPARVPSQVVAGSGVEVSEYPFRPVLEQPVFLMIARLLREKGVREYVAAAGALRRRHPQVRCLLVGALDEHPSAVSRAELDGWVRDGDIEYLGQLADVRPALASAGIYVLPSFYREGIPRSILEALSMGRAVITTDSPGCRETVRDGENGLLVEPRSVPSLLAAMEALALDPQRVARMGAASRQLAEQRFDVHAVNRAMIDGMGLAS